MLITIPYDEGDDVEGSAEEGLDKDEVSKLTKPEIWALEEVKRLLKN